MLPRVKSIACYLITRWNCSIVLIWLLNRFKLIHFINWIIFVINRVAYVHLVWIAFLDICGSLSKTIESTTHRTILKILWVIYKLLIVYKFSWICRFLLDDINSRRRCILVLVWSYYIMLRSFLGVLIWWCSSIVWLWISMNFGSFFLKLVILIVLKISWLLLVIIDMFVSWITLLSGPWNTSSCTCQAIYTSTWIETTL